MATRQRRVVWTQRARDALDEAAAYVADESLSAAVDLIERALAAAESLSTLSERGRIVPELNDPMVRETFVGRYRLLYEVAASRVTVLGFLHGARDFDRWWRSE
jgi:plasmid stabilization system protein ParE